MPAVVKKQKQKTVGKAVAVKEGKKFISESLQKRKPKNGQMKKKVPKHRRRGVVYIKHLPHGFYEDQLRGYFSQFGAITRLRLARSPRTLGSKGYAFIEFRYPEVAEIAADAMSNYLMFKNIIKTRYIPATEIKHDYFRSSIKKVKKDGEKVLTSNKIQAREAIVEATNRLMTDDDVNKRIGKIGSKLQKTKQKLASLGIDYDIDDIAENMGNKVMEASENSKPKTLEYLKLESEDEADDTFDPSGLDINSDDDFEDFEYDSENTDDDDDIDEDIEVEKLSKAVKVAQEARKKNNLESTANVAKKGKRKEVIEPEVSAKKPKTETKGKENASQMKPEPKVTKKAGKKEVAPTPVQTPPTTATKKAAKGKATVQSPKPEEPLAVSQKPSRNTRAPAKLIDAVVEPKAPKGKKGAATKKAQPETETKQTKSKAPARSVTPAPAETSPKQNAKGKKGQKNQKVAPAATTPEKSTRSKKAVTKPQEESPAPVPVKTKKLAKASAGIEKKKPVKDDKKLKMAASVAISSEGADLVKTVKGKEIKGKKKGAGKK